MAQNNPHYAEWKLTTAKYSDDYHKVGSSLSSKFFQKQSDDAQFKANAEKFFGATVMDNEQRDADRRANMPVDPKTLVKNQFMMSKDSSEPRKSKSP